MIRWKKLFGNQYLGFWVVGLLLFAAQELPYMIMPLLDLTENPLMNMPESSIPMDIAEKVLGSLCIVFMILLVQGEAETFSAKPGRERCLFGAVVAVLLCNYFGWLLYFTGHQSLQVILFYLVILPPVYYVLIGLWRKHGILTVTGSIFLVVHVVHVFNNLS